MVALPQAIVAILPAIAADRGRMRGNTMQVILGPGLSEIRQHLSEIDAALGSQSPGLVALDALVTKTERAISTSQPTVPNQHYISQVVLRQFTEPTPAGKVLARFDLPTGEYMAPIGTRGVGSIRDFVPIDSQATEDLWQAVETALPEAIQAALNGTALGTSSRVETLRRAVALHFVRHPQTLTAHNIAFAEALEHQMERLGDTPFAEEAFRQHHGGLHAAGPEGRRLGLERSQGRLRQLHAAGALFRISVQRLFEKVCDRFDTRGIEILIPASSSAEFLIGDAPAVTFNKATGAAGLQGDVAIDVADRIILPLGPRLVVVIGEPNGNRMISDEEVEHLNDLQVRVAKRLVFHRPTVDFAATMSSWRKGR